MRIHSAEEGNLELFSKSCVGKGSQLLICDLFEGDEKINDLLCVALEV